MTSSKAIVLVAVCGLVLTVAACGDRYKRGMAEGYERGVNEGRQAAAESARSEGRAVGYEEGKAVGRVEGDAAGYQRGLAQGVMQGRAEGIDVGRREGRETGTAEGLARGREEGRAEGRAEAQKVARETGRAEGEADGRRAGELSGRAAGIEQGRKLGFAEGVEAGRSQEARRLRSEYAWRVGLPIVVAALLLGLLLNAGGWRTLARIAELGDRVSRELEVRKAASFARMEQAVRERRDNAISPPDVWFVVVTLIGFAIVEYVVESDLAILLLMTLAGFLGAAYAARRNPLLVARLGLFWAIALALVLDLRFAKDVSWLREPAAIAVIAISLYFLWRGLFSSGWKRPAIEPGAGTIESGAVVIAGISVTFQLAWIVTALTEFLAPDLLQSSRLGRAFGSLLGYIRAVSPSTWFPAGFGALALLFAAAVRMGRDPFVPTAYSDVPPRPKNSIAATLLIVPKLPVWLLYNVYTFLFHYLRQIKAVVLQFAAEYLGRLAYLIAALVFPSICILQGHVLLDHAARTIATHIDVAGSVEVLRLAFVILDLLGATLLYLLAVATLPLEIESGPIASVLMRVRQAVIRHGAPAVLLVGTAYAVFHALLIVSLPVVSLMPGSRERGFFVWLCVTILAITTFAFAVNAFRSATKPQATT